jgi:hypothetical protein
MNERSVIYLVLLLCLRSRGVACDVLGLGHHLCRPNSEPRDQELGITNRFFRRISLFGHGPFRFLLPFCLGRSLHITIAPPEPLRRCSHSNGIYKHERC